MLRFQKACVWLCCAALVLSLAACGANPAESAPDSSASASAVPIDRPLSVTITKSVITATGVDIPAAAKSYGLEAVTRNDDGSYTLQMTEAERDAIRAALRDSLDSALLALAESGAWPFLEGVTVDAACQNARLLSRADAYVPVRDDAVAPSVYIPALLYTAFAGGDTAQFTMHFTVLDSDGRTILNEFDYPAPETDATDDPDATDSPNDTE